MHKFTNRLIYEKSTYLKQHAHNPVDWFPWGEEAFAKAKADDKPLFLSIGYATCHWCHVMERESFADPEIAKHLNDTFINVKVDREELPAVDSLYMEFAQSMISGSAGWPLNLVLTPELKPFFACTYLPPKKARGKIGVAELSHRIKTIWTGEERATALAQADTLCQIFSEARIEPSSSAPEKRVLAEARELLYRLCDPVNGGLLGTPKFPLAYLHTFLLNESILTGDPKALFVAERALTKIALGGIYDHLDGGFSRYAVDEEWLFPHFEKMLYDNALLLESYATAYFATSSPLYHRVLSESVRYTLKILRMESALFASAEDSESEGEEGLFHTWLYSDIIAALGENAEEFCTYYGVTPEGNFEGRNVLHITNFDEEVENRLQTQKTLLRRVRSTFPRPLVDQKAITAWNALMIHSLAYAGFILGSDELFAAATETALFFAKQKEIQRRYVAGEGEFSPILDDYVFLIRAYITLFEMGGGTHWLALAMEETEKVETLFGNEAGAYYLTPDSQSSLILRNIVYSDSAEPSGNAIHCENNLRLWALSKERTYLLRAEKILRAVTPLMTQHPQGYLYHYANLSRYHNSKAETLVIALPKGGDKAAVRATLRKSYRPHRVLLWKEEEDTLLEKLLPLTKSMDPIKGKVTFYPCKDGLCSEPRRTL